MVKRPDRPKVTPGTSIPPEARPAFAPVGGGTVGLPQSGAARATVQVPGLVSPAGRTRRAMQQPSSPPPSLAEINQALHRGGALFSAKKFDEAEQIARLILKFLPRQPDALHLLGLVLLAKGNAQEAERLMAKALKLSGNHPVLLVNLGNAARAQGKTTIALKYYNQAEKLFPLHIDTYLERGILEVERGHYSEGLESFDNLIAIDPECLPAYSGAAHAASEQGEFQLAIDYCNRAFEEVGETPIDLLAMVAISYERLSKLPEAIEAAERALEVDPDHFATLRIWAKAKRRQCKRDPEVLKSLRERLEKIDLEKIPAPDSRVIYSELANICEEMGDVDAAFRYFQKQNDKTSRIAAEAGVDAAGFLNDVRTMLEVYTPEVLEQIAARTPRDINSDERVPVFIVGFPRSGTTLLDQIFDAHGDIEVIEERPILREVVRAVADTPRGVQKTVSSMSNSQRKQLRDLYWRRIARFSKDMDREVIVDKMPLSILQIPLIMSLFPNAKIILALRHPADCSLSCFMQDFEINAGMLNFVSLEGTTEAYDLIMTLWQRYEAHLPLNVRRVHYEKLIGDLRGEVEPVLNFLGLEWENAMSDPAAHANARGSIRTPSYAQVTQPIYGSAADRWRRYEKFMAPVLPTLEKHIRYFGYSL